MGVDPLMEVCETVISTTHKRPPYIIFRDMILFFPYLPPSHNVGSRNDEFNTRYLIVLITKDSGTIFKSLSLRCDP